MPPTRSTTATPSTTSRASASPMAPHTARAALIPRHLRPTWPAERLRSRPLSRRGEARGRRSRTGSATWAKAPGPAMSWGSGPVCHKIGPLVKLLRMKPGFGEVLLAEGDPRVRSEEELLIDEFRRQLDEGMWAAVPTIDHETGRREAVMVQDYAEVPRDADRVIFFPRAAGG